MKTLNELYQDIDERNIEIMNINFKKKKAAIVPYDDTAAILVDYSKIEDSKEEKMIIAEEKAHYDTGSYYPLYSADYELIDKMEYKAIKRTYNELIPYSVLRKLAKYMSIDELAEYFGVPIKDVIMASFLYQNIENFSTEVHNG